MKTLILPFLLFAFVACSQQKSTKSVTSQEIILPDDSLQTAYFASGCFWCVEEIFESIKGVKEVVSGYSGGTEKDATYEMVSAGLTNHAETVKLIYDSTIISYDSLLVVFFASHDPTTKFKQGPDVGKQYRSAIFYQNENEHQKAKKYIKKLLDEKTYALITTEVVPFDFFVEAELYHQNFVKNNPYQGYVRQVSIPRFKSFEEKYPLLIKQEPEKKP